MPFPTKIQREKFCDAIERNFDSCLPEQPVSLPAQDDAIIIVDVLELQVDWSRTKFQVSSFKATKIQ